MYGADGWYGWRTAPWNVGALEVWYWSQKPQDLERVAGPSTPPEAGGWVRFLQGQNSAYPEQALERDLKMIQDRRNAVRRDTTPPERRLADNMLDLNPAATESMVQLMWGALLPGREGGLLNARLRYFDPDRKRAGVPEDVAALVSELSDTRAVVTLVNLNASQPRTVIVQGGGYGEHQLVSVTSGGRTTPIDSPLLTVQLDAGARTETRPGNEAVRKHSDRAASLASRECGQITLKRPSFDPHQFERERIGERTILVSLLGQRQRVTVHLV